RRPGRRGRLAADRPQRERGLAEGRPERPRARRLPRRRPLAPRARPGRDRRDPADAAPRPGALSARLLAHGALPERLWPLPGPAARLARDRLHRARRLPLGAAELAAAGAELRRRARAVGAAPL